MPYNFSYRGVKLNKPDNMSATEVKKIIEELGSDGCFSVDQVVKLISEKYKKNEKAD